MYIETALLGLFVIFGIVMYTLKRSKTLIIRGLLLFIIIIFIVVSTNSFGAVYTEEETIDIKPLTTNSSKYIDYNDMHMTANEIITQQHDQKESIQRGDVRFDFPNVYIVKAISDTEENIIIDDKSAKEVSLEIDSNAQPHIKKVYNNIRKKIFGIISLKVRKDGIGYAEKYEITVPE